MLKRVHGMSILLDTQILIWFINGSDNIPRKIKMIIDDPRSDIYVSIASIWEIVLKMNINKLTLTCHFDELFEIIISSNFQVVPIKEKHLRAYLYLPLIHRDPYDRILVSTAISENLRLITSDKVNQQYDVDWIWE